MKGSKKRKGKASVNIDDLYLVTLHITYHRNFWPSHSKAHSKPSRPFCRTRTVCSGSCSTMTFSLLEDDSDCISVTTVNVSKGVATGRNLDFFFFGHLKRAHAQNRHRFFFGLTWFYQTQSIYMRNHVSNFSITQHPSILVFNINDGVVSWVWSYEQEMHWS